MICTCPTCKKRPIVIDNGCSICLFLRSEREQYYQTIDNIFRHISGSAWCSFDHIIYMVYRCLPYICTYKAEHKAEIFYFIGLVLNEFFDDHIFEADMFDVREEQLAA